MTESKELPTAFELLTGGGSGVGMSYYRTVVQCPMKAHLDKEIPRSVPKPGSKPNAMTTGTIFHYLRELDECEE